jgi:hypothetical protein
MMARLLLIFFLSMVVVNAQTSYKPYGHAQQKDARKPLNAKKRNALYRIDFLNKSGNTKVETAKDRRLIRRHKREQRKLKREANYIRPRDKRLLEKAEKTRLGRYLEIQDDATRRRLKKHKETSGRLMKKSRYKP